MGGFFGSLGEAGFGGGGETGQVSVESGVV